MRRDDYENLNELNLPSSDGRGDPMLTSEERRNLDTAHFGQKSSIVSSIVQGGTRLDDEA